MAAKTCSGEMNDYGGPMKATRGNSPVVRKPKRGK